MWVEHIKKERRRDITVAILDDVRYKDLRRQLATAPALFLYVSREICRYDWPPQITADRSRLLFIGGSPCQSADLAGTIGGATYL